jgi:outer membrane protein assembly factor BamB/predicted Ser/Thr protein kinase
MSASHTPPPPEPSRQPKGRAPLESTGEFTPDEQAVKLVQVLDQYLDDLRAGKPASREQLIAAHPDLAADLEACLAGLEFIHAAESPTTGRSPQLGDFRIIREVGRGGMGAVFEAEQISLGRRVALKILRFGAVSDPAAIERFQREAETVAKLHHTNIVPIFAVGTERGVNYFAMQFIEGRSLAEVLAESKGPIAASQVAEWGLQAAEALAHAHARGVIHRDVKPSNLLVDRENRLWLTDFGLARRLDDVTLSLTGALLGTPRYMSPEQAMASKKRVDHRSDLFSLGATLYELLTGQPAFRGDTPHDVIQHILTSEPTPIRQLVRGVPRDLETIVMKCLSKDPGERYNAANDLAGDLRAQLDGRPIRARRANPIELARRWIKQHRRSVSLTAAAAAVTLVVTLLTLFGWSGYAAWQQASLRLDAVSPPLVAELLDERGDSVRIDTLPMQVAARLPAGDYDLRVSTEGTLSQTFALSLTRGHEETYKVNLHDQLLRAPQTIDRSFDVVQLGSEQALVLWTEEGVALQKQQGAALGWSLKLDPEDSAAMQVAPGFTWPWSSPLSTHSGYGSYAYQPWVLQESIDVDGDGMGDLLCAGRHQAWLMAISGQGGGVLWMAPRGAQLTEPRRKDWQSRLNNVSSAALERPLLGPDCDGDGVPELIATFVDVPANPPIRQNRVSARCWLEAISGKTGKTVWIYELPDKLFELQTGEEIPYDMRWFAGGDGGMSSAGRGSMFVGRHISRDRPFQARTGIHTYRPTTPTFVSMGGQKRIGLVAGKHLLLLDPVSGAAVEEPIDLGVRPGTSPQWADVDGDGSTDLVMISARPGVGLPATPTAELNVWSSGSRSRLWSHTLDAFWPQRPAWTVDAPQWPLVADLDSDGVPEVVVPHGRSRGAGAYGGRLGTQETPWGALAVLAGNTGTEVWSRRLVSMDSQVDSFVAGPDIDGDGVRELFAVTLAGNNFTVSVDALSGATGQTLWTGQHVPRANSRGSNAGFVLAPPRWWQAGVDGWPQLLVQIVDEQVPERESLVCAFSAGTGKVSQYGYGMTSLRPADLDGDGLEDLIVFESKAADRCDFGGELKCLRGLAAQPWKRMGSLGSATADLDGDQILDFVQSWGDGTLLATSGASGRELWRSTAIRSSSDVGVQAAGSLPPGDDTRPNGTVAQRLAGDFDGDGIVDLLVWERVAGGRGTIAPLHAVSGRSGKRIWTASEVNVRMIAATLALESRDLDGNGTEEVVWLAGVDYRYPQRLSLSSGDAQLWLFVVSGQTGRVQWSQPLSPQYGLAPGSSPPYMFHNARFPVAAGDLDADGVLDLLAPAILADDSLELRALNGKNGELLWRRSRHSDGLSQQSLENWTAPTICDLEGDGQVEVVLVEPAPMKPAGAFSAQEVQVAALQGQTGEERWVRATGAVFTHFHSFSKRRGDLLRPVPLRSGSGGHRIGVFLPGGDGKLMVFSAEGESQERKLQHDPQPAGLWACDATGDGRDEIVFLDNNGLVLAAVDRLDEPLWTHPLEGMGQRQILKVEPRLEGQSPVIVLAADPTDNSVLGIEASSGKRIWTCPGPIPRDLTDGVYLVPQQIELLGARSGEMPLVAYTLSMVVDCQQAAQSIEVQDTATTAASGPNGVGSRSFAPRGVTVASPRLAGVSSDPRWKRDLPWRSELETGWVPIVRFIGWAMFFSLTLVVIPGVYLVRLVIVRRFGLQTLLALPVIAGIVLTAALVDAPADNDFKNLGARLAIGLLFSPPVVGIGLLVWWLATGRWRRTLVWLAIALLVSALSATSIVLISLRQSPLLPEESLDWTGWYHILAIGGYITSWIAMFVLPLEFAVRSGWRWLAARQRRFLPTAAAQASARGDFDPDDAVSKETVRSDHGPLASARSVPVPSATLPGPGPHGRSKV